MISLLTKKYIQKRAKENGLEYEESSLAILKNIENKEIINGIHLRFSWLYDHHKYLNANALFYKCVLLNPEYAFYLIFYSNNELQNALNISIGHELTHKDKHLFSLRLPKISCLDS